MFEKHTLIEYITDTPSPARALYPMKFLSYVFALAERAKKANPKAKIRISKLCTTVLYNTENR